MRRMRMAATSVRSAALGGSWTICEVSRSRLLRMASSSALPEPAAAAMQDWIAKLETAAAARSALAEYRAQLATN